MAATYNGYGFRQNDNSPVQIVFVAASSEIDEWARVPTRLKGQQRGFQRIDIPGHVNEITQFFKDDADKANSSPTSILIGIEPDAQDRIRLVDPNGVPVDVAAIGKLPIPLVLKVDFEAWDGSRYDNAVDQEIESLTEQVLPLLGGASDESDATDMFDAVEDEANSIDAEEQEGDPSEGEDDDSDGIPRKRYTTPRNILEDLLIAPV